MTDRPPHESYHPEDDQPPGKHIDIELTDRADITDSVEYLLQPVTTEEKQAIRQALADLRNAIEDEIAAGSLTGHDAASARDAVDQLADQFDRIAPGKTKRQEVLAALRSHWITTILDRLWPAFVIKILEIVFGKAEPRL